MWTAGGLSMDLFGCDKEILSIYEKMLKGLNTSEARILNAMPSWQQLYYLQKVLDERNDNLDRAGKDLAGAEEALLTAYGKLKGAEKEYEEAVTGFAGQTGITAEEAATASMSGAVTAGISRETEATEQDISADGTFTEQISPEGSVVSEQTGAENKAPETFGAMEMQQEDTVSINAPEEVKQVTGAAVNSEIIEAVSAAAVTGSKGTGESEEISAKKDKQKNGLLAEVISYIFNGGAIAFILPAGFKRRKRNKSMGGILQGDF